MTFPITKAKGSAVVKIYRTPVKSGKKHYDAYTVRYYFQDKAVRKKFGKLEDAEKEAATALNRINDGTISVLAMTDRDRSSFLRAQDLLKGSGKAVEIAASEYVEAMRILGNAPLIEAARFYRKQHPEGFVKKTVREIYAELLESKKQDKLSESWQKDLRIRLEKFCGQFGETPIIELNGAQIEDWLRGMSLSGRSRNNYRICISTLIGFSKRRKYLPKDFSEMDSVSIAKDDAGDIEVYTPEEMKKLLNAARETELPLLAFGGFAGMRTSEVARLDWSLVKKDWIEVKASKAKTAARRLVPLLSTCAKWIKPIREKSGKVWAFANEELPSETKIALEEASKVNWKKNALRHSFISYRLALIKNTAQVAMECGTSERKIFRNYRELVSESDAVKWFSVLPG